MRLRVFFVALACFVIGTIEAQTVKYVHAIARPGDGVYSMLRLYKLNDHQCNIDQFYKINDMKKGSRLRANRFYRLPLYYYPYNKTSIRSTIGIDNWDQAKKIQAYNRQMKAAKLQAAEYEKSLVLWVPHHMLDCKKPKSVIDDPNKVNKSPEIMPANFTEHSIFGEKYKNVPKLSSKLKGKVYYIVSGHGGPDPGAVGEKSGRDLCEDEYAYDVSLRVCRNLISHGAKAYMIIRDPNDGIRSGEILKCDTDETCWKNQRIPRNQKARLAQRSDAINKLYEYHKKKGVSAADQKTVVIHVDSRSTSERIDLFFYYFPGSSQGKLLAQNLHQVIKYKYDKHQPKRGYTGSVTGRDLHMLRETKPTGVYIELANIRNRNDQKRIILESNRKVLAEWLTEGLIKGK